MRRLTARTARAQTNSARPRELTAASRHSGPVAQNLIAGFSVCVALGALAVSYLSHRGQVRAQAALRRREARVAAREREVERREGRVQASMIEVRTVAARSPLHEGWTTYRLVLVNPGDQPVTRLTASYRGQAVPGVAGPLGPGDQRSFHLARVADGEGRVPEPHDLTVGFTDAAGTRWRREGSGALRRGDPRPDGTWEWRDPGEPFPADAAALAPGTPAGPARPADQAAAAAARPGGAGSSCLRLALAAAVVVTVAVVMVFVLV